MQGIFAHGEGECHSRTHLLETQTPGAASELDGPFGIFQIEDEAGSNGHAVFVDLYLVQPGSEEMPSADGQISDRLFVICFDWVYFLQNYIFGADAEVVEFYASVLKANNSDKLSFLLVLVSDGNGVNFDAGNLLDLAIGDFEFALVQEAAILKGHQTDLGCWFVNNA